MQPERGEEEIMASVKLISEEEVEGKAKEVYEDIKKVKAIMVEPGKLDRMTKEIIAVAVSAVMGCEY
jgi:alkylhydroperoxidase/carboxymuconolactone decarboxylase family protein YurZ